MKTLSLIQCMTLGVIFVLTSPACKKDEPEKPDNPLNGRTTAIFNPDKQYGTITDIDGNQYKTIQIGEQVWMAENLRTTRYRNGDTIPNVTDNETWGGLTTGAFCSYNNTTNLDTIATYGYLYNWHAVGDTRGLAPEGWRVPDINDWAILFEFLGGDSIAGNKMKEAGNLHWEDPFESDNSSGFTALPGGTINRYPDQIVFNNMGIYGIWWTSSEYDLDKAGFLYLFYFDTKVWKGVNYKIYGRSIRCIKE